MIRSTYWVNHNLVLVTLRASERCSPPNLHVFCNPSVRHYFTPVLWPGSLAVYRRLYLPRLPSSVYDLRATKSNRPANLPGQSVSFRQLPSPRPFKRSNSFLPSFNASRLRLFNRETLRFLSLLPFCPVTSYHNGTIAHPWNIYTRREFTRV